MKQQLTYYPSPHVPGVSDEQLNQQVDQHVHKHGTDHEWNGCMHQNHCCKNFYYAPDQQTDQTRELFEQVFDHEPPPHAGDICHNCARLTHDDSGQVACGVYHDRPQICREYLCAPARARARIYNHKRNQG